MTGKEFKLARQQSRLKQSEVARRLHVSQTYVALLESGRRSFPPKLAAKAAALLRMNPLALPLGTAVPGDAEFLVRQLSALGYPGFAHLRAVRRRNPVDVLLAALRNDNLEGRVAEALPWLLLEYGAMSEECKDWLVKQARLHALSNRLGFVVSLAKAVAERRGESTSDVYRTLTDIERELERTRLAQLDTFCQNYLSPAQRAWLERMRPEAAKHWNLLTNWKSEHLNYA
ncbi:MAG: helix-turn-helix transcriptional regulator [Terriglobales bacterium]